ncbi:MAG TPA: SPOR domain-containing protein [Saprospiraceae bacterium]|nr:SPOR domain-containing protein [Saprospiraceae bacterium]
MHSEKVPYFILDLLQQVPSVFVQGLGRFDAIFHPAVIDLQASQIRPPHVKADFFPLVESDEEILPAYMHYVTGIDINDAKENVRLFVNDVLFHVEAGEPFTIEKFGTFSKSAADVLHFTPDWDAFNLSFNGLEVIDLHPEQIKITTPEYEKPEVIIPQFTEHVSRPVYTPVIETNQPIEPVTEEPANDPVVEEHVTPERPGISESTTRLAWIILTSSLVLITMLCAYLAWDIISDRKRINEITQFNPDTLAVTNEFDIPVQMDTQSAQNSTVTVTPPIEKPDTIEKPAVQENTESPCFIIVGAFTKVENINNMIERLQGLGYKSEQIKGGTLTRVAISTSCDKENLQKVLGEARASINPEAWIY